MAVPDAALEALLKEVLRNFEPGAKQKNAAQRSQLHLRSLLNTGQFESRILDSYLSGSYARNTALHPLNDVDIIFASFQFRVGKLDLSRYGIGYD